MFNGLAYYASNVAVRVQIPVTTPNPMPQKKDKIIYKKRAFLNEDVTMSGFVIALVEEFTQRKDGERVQSYPTLDIADCSNKISLDFSFYNEVQMKKSLKKVKLLREVINGFADAFEAEANRIKNVKSEKKQSNNQT